MSRPDRIRKWYRHLSLPKKSALWAAIVFTVPLATIIVESILPSERIPYMILNNTNSIVTIENLPCSDFCADYETLAKLSPGESFHRTVTPVSGLRPYKIYSQNHKLIGCIDLEAYYNNSHRKATINVTDSIACG